MNRGKFLRERLVEVSLEWQNEMGVSPSITSTISEYDASVLVGCPYEEYCLDGVEKTAVRKGYDFVYNNIRYQVKACRPSGKKGSKITRIPKVTNYEWDFLICIIYDVQYNIVEAWKWNVDDYKKELDSKTRISIQDIREGVKLA